MFSKLVKTNQLFSGHTVWELCRKCEYIAQKHVHTVENKAFAQKPLPDTNYTGSSVMKEQEQGLLVKCGD